MVKFHAKYGIFMKTRLKAFSNKFLEQNFAHFIDHLQFEVIYQQNIKENHYYIWHTFRKNSENFVWVLMFSQI